MLKAHFYIKDKSHIHYFLRKIGMYQLNNEKFRLQDEDRMTLMEADVNLPEYKVTFSFSGSFDMESYEKVHTILKELQAETGAEIDDSEALLGYLSNGEKACILTNWDKWTVFLNEARHNSMKGQKVKVYNGNELFHEGILVDYEREGNSSDSFIVKSCTLITVFGEKKFNGQELKIEATGEF
ncbi:hypothetical protein [Pseudalkalibacillus caeni]|uniref:Uncharacterized protein n=1 Tax=Exobacillus caeni TaxID=2574798 RepID=A0A5R9F2D5_9BACL|nr:hypothetical protein [Pseudalkalibacillus caeni]TLS37832.1 hypothetical protein FCL54_08415 [Pseudalkalibacillus caeni]